MDLIHCRTGGSHIDKRGRAAARTALTPSPCAHNEEQLRGATGTDANAATSRTARAARAGGAPRRHPARRPGLRRGTLSRRGRASRSTCPWRGPRRAYKLTPPWRRTAGGSSASGACSSPAPAGSSAAISPRRWSAAGAEVRALVRYNSRSDWGALEHLPERDAVEVRAWATSAIRSSSISLDTHRDRLSSRRPGRRPVRLCRAGAIHRHQRDRHPEPARSGAPARASGRVIHVSTSEVYGSARYTPIDEQHPLQAQSPYAASKIGAEKLAEVVLRTRSARRSSSCARSTPTDPGSPRALPARRPRPGAQRRRGSRRQPGPGARHEPRRRYRGRLARGRDGRRCGRPDHQPGQRPRVTMAALLDIALARRRPRRSGSRSTPRRAGRTGQRSDGARLRCVTRARETLGWQTRSAGGQACDAPPAWIADHLGDYKPQRYAV